MGSNTKNRIILDILIFLSIALMPFWVSFFLIALGFFIFSLFYEAFLFALIFDSIYFIPNNSFFSFNFFSFFITIILFFLMKEFKKRLRI